MTTRAAPLILLLASCGTEPPPELPSDGPADWITEVARNPGAFGALMEHTGRDGWVAFHANDLRKAEAAFVGDDVTVRRARTRVEWSLALLYEDLARASDYAHMAFLSSWAARELPATPGVLTTAAMWRGCGGFDDMGIGDVSKLPAIFRADIVLSDVVSARAKLHEQAAEGDPAPLYAAASEPMVVEPAEGFDRKFYDPCLYHTLHDVYDTKARATVAAADWREVARSWGGEAGLEGRLFAPWLTTGDLEASIASETHPGTLGASQPSLVHFGVSSDMSVQDDVEVARDDVRALDAAIDLRERALLADAGDDGDALLKDLALHHRFRQEWIVTRARKALLEGRPHQAMAYLELARDVSAREVGPSNTPSVLALYAEAQVRLGRTREALDVLVLLQVAHPEVVGFKELVGDLAVLQGLDRHGDSKEN